MTTDVIEVEGGEVVLLSDPNLTADIVTTTTAATVVVDQGLGSVQLVGADAPVVVAAPEAAPSVYVSEQGTPGPPGPPGPAGDPAFVYTQLTPADVWDIQHDRFFPVVTVVDSAGSTVEGDLRHLAANHLQITFGAAFAGLAYLTS